MDVRRASPEDETAMQTLWDAFTAEATFTPYPGSPFTPTMLTEQIAFVAEADGQPVGCVYINLVSEHFGFLFGLYVRPDARKRGVATQLMREAAACLRSEGRPYVVLSVDTPNEAARSLYERLGFADAARILRAEVDDLLE